MRCRKQHLFIPTYKKRKSCDFLFSYKITLRLLLQLLLLQRELLLLR